MNMVLTSVKDEAGKVFLEVKQELSTEVAIRNFKAFCKNQIVIDNKNDFNLYLLGKVDLESGEIIPEHPVKIAMATDFISKKEIKIKEVEK